MIRPFSGQDPVVPYPGWLSRGRTSRQGMSESANVATVIFIGHIVTLGLLSITGVAYACLNHETFQRNMEASYPAIEIINTIQPGTAVTAIFYGYASVGQQCLEDHQSVVTHAIYDRKHTSPAVGKSSCIGVKFSTQLDI
jgi:hypothetical protein